MCTDRWCTLGNSEAIQSQESWLFVQQVKQETDGYKKVRCPENRISLQNQSPQRTGLLGGCSTGLFQLDLISSGFEHALGSISLEDMSSAPIQRSTTLATSVKSPENSSPLRCPVGNRSLISFSIVWQAVLSLRLDGLSLRLERLCFSNVYSSNGRTYGSVVGCSTYPVKPVNQGYWHKGVQHGVYSPWGVPQQAWALG